VSQVNLPEGRTAGKTATAVNDGGPVFPQPGELDYRFGPGTERTGQLFESAGISLRDYFAGQALIGILGSRHGFLVDVGTDNAPSWAYRVADAMLAERAKALTPGAFEIPTVDEMFPRAESGVAPC
jgi:hypothetical protein